MIRLEIDGIEDVIEGCALVEALVPGMNMDPMIKFMDGIHITALGPITISKPVMVATASGPKVLKTVQVILVVPAK
jgi:hypothetical protein